LPSGNSYCLPSPAFFTFPWGFGYSRSDLLDGESFQIGFAQITTLLLSSFLLFKKSKTRQKNPLPLFFLLISFLTIFMMLPYSKIIWATVPLLPQIQFPWPFFNCFGSGQQSPLSSPSFTHRSV